MREEPGTGGGKDWNGERGLRRPQAESWPRVALRGGFLQALSFDRKTHGFQHGLAFAKSRLG
jgi:hypothetical protein